MVTGENGAMLLRLQTDLMARIGTALIQIQVTEKLLKLVTTLVLQRSSFVTADGLLDQMEAERKKTMGYFLTELRKRADLDQHFDATLAEFLRRRNTLVHHLSDLPGWDTQTVSGIDVGRQFLNELLIVNRQVLKVFSALVRAWEIQIGRPAPPDSEFFREIDEKYVPLVDSIFSAKTDT